MSVTVSSVGPVITARLTGEIDTYSVPDVRAAFGNLELSQGALVIVDLREVTFLDSSGIGAIIGLYPRVGHEGARLRVVCGAMTLRLMRLMHLDQVLDVVMVLEDDPVEGGSPSGS